MRTRFFGMMALLLILGTSFGNEVEAYRPLTLDEALEKAGLTGPVAEKNMKISQHISDHLENLKTQLGAHYAGTWIEYDAHGKAYQVIASTEPIAIQNKPENYEIKNIVVMHSLAKLEAILYDMAERYLYTPIEQAVIYSMYVNFKKNKIIVRGKRENFDFIREKLMNDQYPIDLIDFEEQDAPVTLHGDLYGGSQTLALTPETP